MNLPLGLECPSYEHPMRYLQVDLPADHESTTVSSLHLTHVVTPALLPVREPSTDCRLTGFSNTPRTNTARQLPIASPVADKQRLTIYERRYTKEFGGWQGVEKFWRVFGNNIKREKER